MRLALDLLGVGVVVVMVWAASTIQVFRAEQRHERRKRELELKRHQERIAWLKGPAGYESGTRAIDVEEFQRQSLPPIKATGTRQ
jgi:hypothetical protein